MFVKILAERAVWLWNIITRDCWNQNIFLFSFQFYSKNKGIIATTLQKPKEKEGTKSAALQLSKSNYEILLIFF